MRNVRCQKSKNPISKFLRCVEDNNGLFVTGFVNTTPCRMIIDTGASDTIFRKDVVRDLGLIVIWIPLCVTLETDDKIQVHGKVRLNENVTFQHVAYVSDINDPLFLDWFS